MDPQANNTIKQQSPSGGTAVAYITVGTLAAIWGGIWLYFIRTEADVARWQYYVSTGVLLSGLALAVIGVLVGRIGAEAQHADVPVGPAPQPAPAVQQPVVQQPAVAAPQANGAVAAAPATVPAQAAAPMAAAAPARQS